MVRGSEVGAEELKSEIGLVELSISCFKITA